MNAKRLVLAAALALSSPTWANPPAVDDKNEDKPARSEPAQKKTVTLCEKPLPALRSSLAFMPGEQLEFELDALGAKAGVMRMHVQRQQGGELPVQVEVRSSSFMSKVRRVRAKLTTFLHPRTLRPSRHVEDTVENEVPRTVSVVFGAKDRSVKMDATVGKKTLKKKFTYDKDVLDLAGAIYAIRQLRMKDGLPVCADVYGTRRMWRLSGTVLKREHVTTPLGEFDAWHLSGTAVRLDKPSLQREVHVWISDDARRLPLAAVGAIDLGAVRATLTSVSRPGEKRLEAGGMEDFKW
jgi:hypothetical protein